MQYFKRYYPVYVLAFALFVGAALLVIRQDSAQDTSQPQEFPVTLVIDPGHGGEDGGAVTPGGEKESALNLEISLRLGDLCALLGYPCRMLRTEDVMLYDTDADSISQKKVSDLKARVRMVKETPGALLISIHQNSFPQGPQYCGAQVFYAASDGSQALAELLQKKIGEVLDPSNRRACKPSEHVYLMEHIDCTGILLECGFLTNAEEAARLRDPGYQKQLVCVVFSALSTYLKSHNEA